MIRYGSRGSRSWGPDVIKREVLNNGEASGSEDDLEYSDIPLESGGSGKGQRLGINSGAVPQFEQATGPWEWDPGDQRDNTCMDKII